jgi:hypothetical protein
MPLDPAFSNVRIHTNENLLELHPAVDALDYTCKRNQIIFDKKNVAVVALLKDCSLLHVSLCMNSAK